MDGNNKSIYTGPPKPITYERLKELMKERDEREHSERN